MKHSDFRLLKFNRLLCLLFKISHSALKSYKTEEDSFAGWCKVKSQLNYRMNRAVFWYLGRARISAFYTEDTEMETQFILDAVNELVIDHYKVRQKIFFWIAGKGVSEENLFITLSLAWVYIKALRDLLRAITGIGVRFLLIGQQPFAKVCLAVGFPSHSFTIPKVGNELMSMYQSCFFSFGEYLSGDMKANGKYKVISILEYIRYSKQLEKVERPSNAESTDETALLPRITAKKKRSLHAFLVDLCILLKSLKRGPSPIGLLFTIKAIYNTANGIKYRMLISNLQLAELEIRKIFIMPGVNLADLRYDRKLESKVYTYSYSENIFIPPAPHCLKFKNRNVGIETKDLLSEISLGAFSFLIGGAVGCTQIYQLLNKARKSINQAYGCTMPICYESQPKQHIAMLGYESKLSNLETTDFVTLGVFDVPPDCAESQLKRALVGDRTNDLPVVIEYLEDIFNCVLSHNIRILFKPKYSLRNYVKEYSLYIEDTKLRLGDKFIVVSPYSSIDSIILLSDILISFPYTSTKIYGDMVGRSSFYYISERYRRQFKPDNMDSTLISGKKKLDEILNQTFLRKKSQSRELASLHSNNTAYHGKNS